MFSGEADSATLSSQQGALDQGPGMIGMTTAADDEELLVCLCSIRIREVTISQFIKKEQKQACKSSAGVRRFDSWRDQHSLNNWVESAAFVFASANG